MDFNYSPEQEAYRMQVRGWLEANQPPPLTGDERARISENLLWERNKKWHKKLYAGGANTTDNKGHEYDITLRPEKDVREFDLAVAGTIRFAGIYKFVGDDIHIAYLNGQIRPTDYAPGPGKNIPILKRLAEAKK